MNGVINVLKPPAMTSNDVVCRLRWLLKIKRVGHTGTLDPGAAGVLPVCIGRATKIADYIMCEDKEYIAQVTFGIQTDTQDSYGVVTRTCDCAVSTDDLLRILPQFLGNIEQIPPMYSAVKHEGKKLYQLARQGIAIQKPPRKIYINEIEILNAQINKFLLRINCSKGTYVRSLCADMGDALHTCAHTSFLMRTKTCGFNVESSYTLDEIETKIKDGTMKDCVLPMEQAIGFLKKIVLEDYLYDIATTGTPIDLKKAGIDAEFEKDYSVFCKDKLIGIAQREEDTLKIKSMIQIRENNHEDTK
ncbi:MAG: tRNA pseudouridine(55) synthase TruB [Christensenellaceae bacterium]